jgi:type II secretory pathway pseudopilin PulG
MIRASRNCSPRPVRPLAPGARAAARSGPRGFSLIEALAALSVTALAGAVLLLAVESALVNSTQAVQRTIADGVAQQLLDEMLTKRYVEPGESGDGSTGLLGPLGATAFELLGAGTQRFNDIDDYAGYAAQPLVGAYGETLGTGDDAGGLRNGNFRVPSDTFANWRIRAAVYYVNPTDHTVASSEPTAYRAIEVFVELIHPDGVAEQLAHRKRVIAYIPPTP